MEPAEEESEGSVLSMSMRVYYVFAISRRSSRGRVRVSRGVWTTVRSGGGLRGGPAAVVGVMSTWEVEG